MLVVEPLTLPVSVRAVAPFFHWKLKVAPDGALAVTLKVAVLPCGMVWLATG